MRDLDREYADEVMPADARASWNRANEVLDDLRARDNRIAELFHRGAVESATDTFRPGGRSSYMTDRYRHLLDGHEAAPAERFEDYLARATGARTGA